MNGYMSIYDVLNIILYDETLNAPFDTTAAKWYGACGDAQVRTILGKWNDTTQFGASTISLIRRSPQTEHSI